MKKHFALIAFSVQLLSLVVGIAGLWLADDKSIWQFLLYACVSVLVASFLLYLGFLHLATNYLRRLLSSMPVLYKKTAHLRDHLSKENLDRFWYELRSTIGKFLEEQTGQSQGPANHQETTDRLAALDKYDMYLDESDSRKAEVFILANQESFIAEGARRLLSDLKNAITDVMKRTEFTCSVKLYVGDGDGAKFSSVYAGEPDQKRLEEEQEYLMSKNTSLASYVLCNRFRIKFDTLDDTVDSKTNPSQTVKDIHKAATWPGGNMGTYIQSGILCPIVCVVHVDADGQRKEKRTAVAVLQVDSPRPKIFTSWFDPPSDGRSDPNSGGAIEHMVQCTADALGALISTCHYVNYRCIQTKRLQLNAQLKELELTEKNIELTKLNQHLMQENREIREQLEKAKRRESGV